MSYNSRLGEVELDESDAFRLAKLVPSGSRNERVQKSRRTAEQLYKLVGKCSGIAGLNNIDIIAGMLHEYANAAVERERVYLKQEAKAVALGTASELLRNIEKCSETIREGMRRIENS